VTERGWSLVAPAKLNLRLSVIARRPDGFHELDTVLVLLELADVVVVSPGTPGISVGGPQSDGVPTDESNLAWRGWSAGLDGRTAPWSLALDKRVPRAAGMGGGSSDAAAAWRLARWVSDRGDAVPTADDLDALARVGADVPFLASQAAAARVRGIGERVEAIPLETGPQDVVLVHPPFGLATGSVFAALRSAEWSGAADGAPLVPGRNDLAAAARRLRPELDDIFRLVAGAGGEPHLTGSGPTIFALMDDPERATGIAARLRRAGLRVTETRTRREPASIESLRDEQEDA
jgi:4-diphosphocytidyl-2-C-methyl-D-erythritol kinase